MFTCEICEIFKDTYFEEHLRTTASIWSKYHLHPNHSSTLCSNLTSKSYVIGRFFPSTLSKFSLTLLTPTHKMVKHTQAIRQLLPTNCLGMFNHFVGLALKELDSKSKALIIHFKNNHRKCSVKRDIYKNFVIFTGKHPRWSLFLIKLQTFRPATLLKRESNSSVFP